MTGESHSGDMEMMWWVDNISYIQGSAQALVIIHCPRFNCLSEKEVGGLEGCIGLPALQPVSCRTRFCVGGEGHGRLVYKYTWSTGCYATWCNMSVPSSCCSLEAFK